MYLSDGREQNTGILLKLNLYPICTLMRQSASIQLIAHIALCSIMQSVLKSHGDYKLNWSGHRSVLMIILEILSDKGGTFANAFAGLIYKILDV